VGEGLEDLIPRVVVGVVVVEKCAPHNSCKLPMAPSDTSVAAAVAAGSLAAQ